MDIALLGNLIKNIAVLGVAAYLITQLKPSDFFPEGTGSRVTVRAFTLVGGCEMAGNYS